MSVRFILASSRAQSRWLASRTQFKTFRRNLHSSRFCLGTVPFKLADIGEGISEVEILQWHVAPGDNISQFDAVCEVQSDKATVEITSRYDGVVQTLGWKVGEMAKVGSTLMEIEVAEGSKEAAKQSSPAADVKVEKSEKVASDTQTIHSDPERPRRLMGTQGSFTIDPVLTPIRANSSEVKIEAPPRRDTSLVNGSGKPQTTPAVRRLANDHNIDLSLIKPSGRGGRVLKSDVLDYIAKASQVKHVVTEDPPSSIAQAPVQAPDTVESTKTFDVGVRLQEDLEVPITGIQRMMVKSMTSALTIPHFNFMEEYDMTATVEFRKQLNEQLAGELKISYLPIILKAVSLALLKYPAINAHVNSDVTSLVHKASHNIGVAMDTERGLIVPVIKDVQELSIIGVATELQRLQTLASQQKLTEGDLSGATITLSNIGSIGGTYASAVIVPPQVAIGAMGKMRTIPVFDNDGEVSAATVMNISWAADHRVIDGASMARFSNEVKRFLEYPVSFSAHGR